MKAVVKYGYGKHETEVREVPIPIIGDDDVLMEVKAAGVCGSDISFDEGGHENLLRPPVILGHEFAGVVAAAGKNVMAWREGDRVVSDNTGHVCGVCHACSVANFLVCPSRLGLGYGMDGGFARYVRIPGDALKIFPGSLMRIPDSISFEEAAILDPACNAYMAVVQESSFLPGEIGAVFGVGALGQFAIQMLRASGASRIIAVGLSDDEERFPLAMHNGAVDIIRADKEDVLALVAELTDGEGVALTVDCAGAPSVVSQAIDICRAGGEIVKIGYNEKPLGFSLDKLLDKAVSIKGHYGYNRVSWANVMNLIVAGQVDMKSMISHRMPISEFRNAFSLVKQRKAIKIILTPED
jgi:threonine dehydrogenase-like Zn-dependent dehydrogenase